MRIEDYAFIGDGQTIALVGIDGSIDWLCLPRFDSGACFAALLGTPEHGRFLLAPVGDVVSTRRRYREDSLVLETEMQTADGTVRIVDAMPMRGEYPDVARIVEGVSGRVRMRVELVIRLDYGAIVPWVRKIDGRLHAVAGPDGLVLATPIKTHGKGRTTVAEFEVSPGDRVPFILTWHPSWQPAPRSPSTFEAIDDTDRWWREWASRTHDKGQYRDAIVRSLITLKALTYAPTGGIVAAATTSLPEAIGGERNWDYRYCWLRDATFTLLALLQGGYNEEARAWRDWLLRAAAGDPGKLQIMYGLAGERRLDERTIEWLPGYEGSRPVRVGNAAAGQLQLDVYGEVIDTFYQARTMGIEPDPAAWHLETALCDWLESGWREPDAGLWEVRGAPRCFTHSKVMAWVALDRAVKSIEQLQLPGPLDRWRRVRDTIHEEVCRRAFHPGVGAFTEAYESDVIDASTLLIPSVGFLPGDDPRVLGTIRAVERTLLRDGFVRRYPTSPKKNLDGLVGEEAAFLACSFWLVDAYQLAGRHDDARRLFQRLLAVRNDVGLLSEEYDVDRKRLIGNFPQAFSHVGLINSARALTHAGGGARE